MWTRESCAFSMLTVIIKQIFLIKGFTVTWLYPYSKTFGKRSFTLYAVMKSNGEKQKKSRHWFNS